MTHAFFSLALRCLAATLCFVICTDTLRIHAAAYSDVDKERVLTRVRLCRRHIAHAHAWLEKILTVLHFPESK